MFRVGFLGLLLLLLSVNSFAQSAPAAPGACSGQWQEAEADTCLLPFAQAREEDPSIESASSAASGDSAVPNAPSALARNPNGDEGAKLLDSSSADTATLAKPESDLALTGAIIPVQPTRPRFQWGAAVGQSAKLLVFQQGMMLATDKWARWSLTHGKFFKEYVASVRGGLRQWDDGDPFLDNYIGHPLQGAVTGFIQVQNDPHGRALSFGNNKAYWKSRLKAMGWSAAYSTQFEIGPISEASIENLGSFVYRNCDNCPLVQGSGWVDIVVTPTLGTAWLIGEDAIDRYLVRRIERKLGPGKWSNFFRSVLNPGRVAANVLRLKAPWHRDNRNPETRPLE